MVCGQGYLGTASRGQLNAIIRNIGSHMENVKTLEYTGEKSPSATADIESPTINSEILTGPRFCVVTMLEPGKHTNGFCVGCAVGAAGQWPCTSSEHWCRH